MSAFVIFWSSFEDCIFSHAIITPFLPPAAATHAVVPINILISTNSAAAVSSFLIIFEVYVCVCVFSYLYVLGCSTEHILLWTNQSSKSKNVLALIETFTNIGLLLFLLQKM